MTSTTADGPALADEDLPGKGSGPARDAGDPFGADTLPAPRGGPPAPHVTPLTPERAPGGRDSHQLQQQQAARTGGP
ncbi:ABC transporter ATP-binding protein, partial [[Kitasatospora] papulosa]